MKARIDRLKDLERMESSGAIAMRPKKEAAVLRRELERLQKYLGGLRKDIPHGYGRLRTKDGESYYGEFDEGAPSGYGTLFSRDGLILFTGLWKGDKAVAGESPQARLRARLNLP